MGIRAALTSKFLVVSVLVASLILPTPAVAGGGMCAFVFSGKPRNDRVAAEIAFDIFAKAAAHLQLSTVNPNEFPPLKKEVTIEFIRRKLINPDLDLNLSGRNLHRLVMLIYSKRYSSLPQRLKLMAQEQYTRARIDRRSEQELLTLKALRDLTETGLLKDPRVEKAWRAHLTRSRAGYIVLNILMSSGSLFLPINPYLNLYLPATSLSNWRRVPVALIDRALADGLTPQIRTELNKYFEAPYQADRAWDALRLSYNIVTTAMALWFLQDQWDWVEKQWYTYQTREGWEQLADTAKDKVGM